MRLLVPIFFLMVVVVTGSTGILLAEKSHWNDQAGLLGEDAMGAGANPTDDTCAKTVSRIGNDRRRLAEKKRPNTKWFLKDHDRFFWCFKVADNAWGRTLFDVRRMERLQLNFRRAKSPPQKIRFDAKHGGKG